MMVGSEHERLAKSMKPGNGNRMNSSDRSDGRPRTDRLQAPHGFSATYSSRSLLMIVVSIATCVVNSRTCAASCWTSRGKSAGVI